MAITRANVEAILIKRAGRLLAAAGLDGTTVNGTNADLNDPIRKALQALSHTVADVTAVADADLSGVAADDLDKLLDVAELRVLESILGNLDDVDITVGPRSESLGQLADRVEKAITRKREAIQREHGIGVGTLSAGVLGLDFMQKDEDETEG